MQRPYVNFSEVKERIPIPDALAVLGLAERFDRKGDTLSGVCPLPGHKHGPHPNPEQFKINRREGVWLWHCFGDCQRGGDVVELVKAMTSYDNAHVRFWFAEHFGDRLSIGKNNGSKPVEKDTARVSREETTQAAPVARPNLPEETAPLKPLRFRLNLDPAVPYLRERGLTAETIERYGIGLCSRGVLKGYIAMPVYSHEDPDAPVAYLGRWPGEDHDESVGRPRYKWPEGFSKSRVLYGLAEAMKSPAAEPLVVVEGPFKVFHLVQAGWKTAVACFGSSLSDDQANILVETERPIILLFDGDEAGGAGAEVAVQKLVTRTFLRVAKVGSGRDVDQLSLAELNTLLF